MDVLSALAAVVPSSIGERLVREYFRRKLRRHDADISQMSPAMLRRLRSVSGDKTPMIHITEAGVGSHYSVPLAASALLANKNVYNGLKSTKNRELAKRLGYIGIAEGDRQAHTIAHELGHASLANPSTSGALSRLNQFPFSSISRVIGRFVPVLAGVNAGLATDDPLIGSAVGLGTGAVLNAPTLINEHQATNRANKWLDKMPIPGNERLTQRKALNSALGTYYSSAIIPGALSGLGVMAAKGLAGD